MNVNAESVTLANIGVNKIGSNDGGGPLKQVRIEVEKLGDGESTCTCASYIIFGFFFFIYFLIINIFIQ